MAETKYRLKKTISMPGPPIPIGTELTAKQWKKLFPQMSWKFGWPEWFMEIKPQPDCLAWVNEEKDE